MGLEEAKGTGIYTIDAAHRPPCHMTLMGKVMHVNEHPKRSGNQIPGDPACKTGLWVLQDDRVALAWRPCGIHATTMCVALW
jgi:hypothetical protein